MEVDPTRMCELLVGLPAVRVLGIVDEVGGPLWSHVEARAERPVCGGCSGAVVVKDRTAVGAGRPARLRPSGSAGVAQAPLELPEPGVCSGVVDGGSAARRPPPAWS